MSASAAAPAARTPWHFWVVGLLAAAWNAMGAVDYTMTQTHNAAYLSQVPEAQLAFLAGVPAWGVAAWAIGVWGAVVGTVLLLLRRAWAVPVFLASLIGAVIVTIRTYLLANGLEVFGGVGGIGFSLLILLVAFGLYRYAVRLRANGMLR